MPRRKKFRADAHAAGAGDHERLVGNRTGERSGGPGAAIQGRDLAYTTVQTMLNVLHRKGKVNGS